MSNHKKIYKEILTVLSDGATSRRELVAAVVERLSGNSSAELPVGGDGALRGEVGRIISEMEEKGVISPTHDGGYVLAYSKTVALRLESCEREILNLLRGGAMTRAELRSNLESHFGTDRTATKRDDNILFTYIGQVLKRLVGFGVLDYDGSRYTISAERLADVDDISAMVSLKADFLERLHRMGGEFFEHYFMALLERYLTKHGKTVTECYTTGGSADGGIDGVIKTVDVLGFRETVLVQTKNRLEITSETTVRGFYGAVCAQGGSRGIFATTSDMHPVAKDFLLRLDNCVGVNGDDIFRMAIECHYGIKRVGGRLAVDSKIIK